MAGNNFLIKSIFKSLKFGYQRVLVIAVAIFIGAMVSGAFLNIYFDIDSKMSKELKAFGANLIITANNDENFIDQNSLKDAISKIDKTKIIGYTPYLYGFYNLQTTNGIVAGVDFAGLKKTKPFLEIRKGSMNIADFKENSAFLGLNLAKILEAKIGQKIVITNQQNLKSTQVIVKGIFYGGDESDEIMFISLKNAQLLHDDGDVINYADAVISGNFGEILKISDEISSKKLNAKPVAQISLSQGVILEKIKALMALISIVILIISSTSVNTTLSSIIFSRKKEIALNMVLGATKKDIIKLFGYEIFLLALIASILGGFCGYFLAQILGLVIFQTGINFRLISVIIAVFISLICSGFAAYYPLKQALKINLAENLRKE